MARQDVVGQMARQGAAGEIAFGRERDPVVPVRALARESSANTAVQAVAERMLLDAVERAQRREAGVEALLLRLSLLPQPGARPHHRRVARSLLDEAALRRGGQVFALRNLDFVLLGPEAGSNQPLLARLFNEVEGVVQVLAPGAALLAYARERAADPLPLPAAVPELAPLSPLGAAEALLQRTQVGDLLHGQVAAELLPDGALRPLFREVNPRLPALLARLPGGQAADPLLFRDLAAKLAARTLAAVAADVAQGGPLLVTARGPALHLNLTLSAVLSPEFARFAEAVHARGGRAGIEVDLVEAWDDPAAFDRVKELARAARFTLALDGVGHQALLLTRPGRLGADLVKVAWSDALAAGPDAAALQEIGPARVVLTGADGEAAMRWGYARKVRRFQGAHVDVMLAAARHGACAFASGCTLRLCAERASATSAAGRTGCRNTALLDGAVGERP